MIKSLILRKISRLFGYRPYSSVYISGDGFRSMADHIYDESKKCEATDIKEGDIVFLNTDLVEKWFKTIHPLIKNRYKLITHNSDAIVGEYEARHIDEKIITWFAQNNTFRHKKIVPIPIGIENQRFYHFGWTLERCIKKINKKNISKRTRILFGFNVQTNINKRTEALHALRKCDIADEIKEKIDPLEYFEKLSQYAFVASPEGNGPDCHRTWEALYLGVIPIVTNTACMNYFKELGLPIHIITTWSELTISSTEFRDSQALYLNFWKDIILYSHE